MRTKMVVFLSMLALLVPLSPARADCWTTLLSEDFDSYSDGDWPSGFYHFGLPYEAYPGTHVVSAVEPRCPTPSNCFMNTNPYDSWGSDVTVPLTFTPADHDLLIFQADVMFPASSAGTHRNDVDIGIVTLSPQTTILKVMLTQPQAEEPVPPEDELFFAATDGGVLSFLSADGNFDEWFHVRGMLDLNTGTYDVYVNGNKIGTGLSINPETSVEDIGALFLGKGFLNSGSGYFDNVAVRVVKEDGCPPPSLPGKIIFSYRTREMSRFDLWEMNADGTGMKNLTMTTDTDEFGPCVSPDGQHIAYLKIWQSDQDNNGIYVMAANGTDQRQIVRAADYDWLGFDYSLVWTDSTSLIFTAVPELCRTSVFKVDIEGGEPEFLFSLIDVFGESSGSPTDTSPDGSQFAVIAQGGCWAPSQDVYAVNTDGTDSATVYADSIDDFTDNLARWSPSGYHMAFTHTITQGGNNRPEYCRVATIEIDGDNLKMLTDTTESCYLQDWSPDGTKLLYFRLDDEIGLAPASRSGNLFVMNADGSNAVQLTDLDGWFSIPWLPVACWYLPDLTTIHLKLPLNGALLTSPPLFEWEVDGGGRNGFALDFSLNPGFLNYWSSYDDLHQILQGTSFVTPQYLWNRVPRGKNVYWRVRGADMDKTPIIIITSDESWWFRKQ